MALDSGFRRNDVKECRDYLSCAHCQWNELEEWVEWTLERFC